MAFKRRRLLGHSAFAPCFQKVGVSGEVNLCLNLKRYERETMGGRGGSERERG